MFVALKQVLWSNNGYRAPSGDRKRGKQHADKKGFALEEWNASTHLAKPIKLSGQLVRSFHAEPVKAAMRYPGSTVIILYSTHRGSQMLLGAASRATNAVDDKRRAQLRQKMGSRLSAMAYEAWRTPGVADRFKNKAAFNLEYGPKGTDTIPGWYAPVDRFFWLDSPAPIDVVAATGKSKLLTHYRGSTYPTSVEASKILRSVPKASRSLAWQNIVDDLFDESVSTVEELAAIATENGDLGSTTRDAVVQARVGQGPFRDGLLDLWGNSCALTVATTKEALRASHIRPWSKCKTDRQRLDPNNGLLLVATLDALFDKHLISFDRTGRILIADRIRPADRRKLGLVGRMSLKLRASTAAYMKEHRLAFEENNKRK